MQITLDTDSQHITGRRPRNWCKFFLILFFMSSNVVAFADQLQWDKTPLKLDLEVQTERFLHFSFPVDIGVPTNLKELVRVQIVGKSVYLTATRGFERQRFLVRSREDGTVMVFDIKADTVDVGSKHIHISDASRSTIKPSKKRWTPTSLTRYAARVMYAPKRLRMSSIGLTQAPLPEHVDQLVLDERIKIQPIASWKSEQGLYVTVVVLTNISKHAIELHPSKLRGDWTAATFHHYRLLPNTTSANVTAVYLISKQPFAHALDL